MRITGVAPTRVVAVWTTASHGRLPRWWRRDRRGGLPGPDVATTVGVGAEGDGVEDLRPGSEAGGRSPELSEHDLGGIPPARDRQHQEVAGRRQAVRW